MEPLHHSTLRGNWATLLLPILSDDRIDYEALADEIDFLIKAEVNGIYSNGTAGEFYTQTEKEFDQVNSMLAEKCNRARIPFQIGCSHMSPQISLERIKRSVFLKPSAIQVILPDWYPPSIHEIVDFLKVMEEAAHPVGLVLYNPPHAKVKLGPDDFRAIREADVALIGCKVAGGDANWYAAMKEANPDLSLFVPGHTLATGIASGAHGAYSNIACLNPRVAQAWYQQMLTDLPGALALEKRILHFISGHIIPYMTVSKFSSAAIDKFLAAIGGWARVGTRVRWPYKSIGEDEVMKARKICSEILPEFFKENAIH